MQPGNDSSSGRGRGTDEKERVRTMQEKKNPTQAATPKKNLSTKERLAQRVLQVVAGPTLAVIM